MRRVVTKKLGKYEVARTIGQGTFAKVNFAKNIETGESVAIKVMEKSTILKHKMVLASRTKIYMVLEFVTGGELFDKIVHQGRLSENEARRYFQQLIDAVAHCHSKGVYHRDLKPQNLLLDSQGNLKISDFGLGALPQQGVDLLHTTCGTPNYVAPETRLEGVSANKAGQFAVVLEVFEVAPSLFVVDVRKAAADTLEYHKFYKNFCSKLDGTIWKTKEGVSDSAMLRTMTC